MALAEQPLQTLVYYSSAKKLFTEAELLELLVRARDANHRFGITGMLLYKSGSFMQVIEGNRDAVHQLFDNIVCDQTHQSILKVIDEKVSERTFPHWSMAFMEISPTAPPVEGFSDFFKNEESWKEFQRSPSKLKKLLAHFRALMKPTI